MATSLATLPVITDDEKRQILYSALLRHFPEAKPLRARALERLVLGALYGSTANAPATVSTVYGVLRLVLRELNLS